jgi:hypothetical protein
MGLRPTQENEKHMSAGLKEHACEPEEKQQVPPRRFGRDDNSVEAGIDATEQPLTCNRIVIPTAAYPDFLLRAASLTSAFSGTRSFVFMKMVFYSVTISGTSSCQVLTGLITSRGIWSVA